MGQSKSVFGMTHPLIRVWTESNHIDQISKIENGSFWLVRMDSLNPHTAPVSRVVPISRYQVWYIRCSVFSFHILYFISSLGGARNRAIAMSSGEYLCIQDSDDIMLPERLRLQVSHTIWVILFIIWVVLYIISRWNFVLARKKYWSW